ncbi:MAG: hypothetical protein H6658_10755 [Ardenticatenaceae bacterium]|nr:hypothetical protein [Ardenticatenaceae bacterium]
MNKFTVLARDRDESSTIIKYDLMQNDKVLLSSVPYRIAIDHVYSVIRKGDLYQEFYLEGGKSEVLTFEQVYDSSARERAETRKNQSSL